MLTNSSTDKVFLSMYYIIIWLTAPFSRAVFTQSLLDSFGQTHVSLYSLHIDSVILVAWSKLHHLVVTTARLLRIWTFLIGYIYWTLLEAEQCIF